MSRTVHCVKKTDAAIIASIALVIWNKRRQEATGQRLPAYWISFAMIFGLPLLVMFATGRLPNVAGLGLEAAGVKLAKNGAIQVDDFYCSSVPSIHAIGDVIDRVQLTPVALAQGMAVALTGSDRLARALDQVRGRMPAAEQPRGARHIPGFEGRTGRRGGGGRQHRDGVRHHHHADSRRRRRVSAGDPRRAARSALHAEACGGRDLRSFFLPAKR